MPQQQQQSYAVPPQQSKAVQEQPSHNAAAAKAYQQPGISTHLLVAGGSSEAVSKHISGTFTLYGENHGRKVYKKDGLDPGQMEVMIYFWDQREGEALSGWWIGPQIGGTLIWAHNSIGHFDPPTRGWKVPWNGDVDPALIVTPVMAPPVEAQGRIKRRGEELASGDGPATKVIHAHRDGGGGGSGYGQTSDPILASAYWTENGV